MAYSFTDACCDMNSITELREALAGPVDMTDCKAWGITPKQWREDIELAIKWKLDQLAYDAD